MSSICNKLKNSFDKRVMYWNTNTIHGAIYNYTISDKLIDSFFSWIEYYILQKIQYEYLEFSKNIFVPLTINNNRQLNKFNVNKIIDNIVEKITTRFIMNIDKRINARIEMRNSQRPLNDFQVEDLYIDAIFAEIDFCLNPNGFNITKYIS
jgi:hypothetical protein